MMRLEFVMILIRKGAVGVYSLAMLTLQGAWSQLKICADQTACPRYARLSLEPLLLQRDGQAQGLLLPPNRLQRSRRSNTRHSPPWDPIQGSAIPISCILRWATNGQPMSGSTIKEIPPFTNVCEKTSHTHLIPTEILSFSTREQPNFPSHSEWERHIKLELCDNLERQLNLILITLFLLFRAIPAMLPDPGGPKIDKFKWIQKATYIFQMLIFLRNP